MLQGNISPTKKPDADNVIKIVLDAMNKFAFKDDTQVTKLDIEKKWIFCKYYFLFAIHIINISHRLFPFTL